MPKHPFRPPDRALAEASALPVGGSCRMPKHRLQSACFEVGPDAEAPFPSSRPRACRSQCASGRHSSGRSLWSASPHPSRPRPFGLRRRLFAGAFRRRSQVRRASPSIPGGNPVRRSIRVTFSDRSRAEAFEIARCFFRQRPGNTFRFLPSRGSLGSRSASSRPKPPDAFRILPGRDLSSSGSSLRCRSSEVSRHSKSLRVWDPVWSSVAGASPWFRRPRRVRSGGDSPSLSRRRHRRARRARSCLACPRCRQPFGLSASEHPAP